jgi:hypothetical protein
VFGLLIFFVFVNDGGFAVVIMLVVLSWVMVMILDRKPVLLCLSGVKVDVLSQVAAVGNVVYALDVDV